VGLQQLYIIPNVEKGIVKWEEAVTDEVYKRNRVINRNIVQNIGFIECKHLGYKAVYKRLPRTLWFRLFKRNI
jgi:hypothetical protein